jgi:signal peptidase I
MEPTLNVGDRVLVNKLSYRFHDVNRGDLIVFERPESATSQDPGENQIRDLIKRVVAVGGDTIEARDQLVYVNGERVDESGYLASGTPTDNLPRQTIPDGHVFVMGDNRDNSEDSRVFGPVDEDRIVGRAFLRVLPVGNIGWL